MRYLQVWADYMSTGLRDEFAGPIEPESLGLDDALSRWLRDWVSRYETITPLGDEERAARAEEIAALDREGMGIAAAIQDVLQGDAKVSYFSEGLLKKLMQTGSERKRG